MKTTARIIDSTSRNEIKGRIGRFIVTHYRRGMATEGAWGVFEGVRTPKAAQHEGIGKGELIAVIKAAMAHNADRSMSFVHVVSLYDAGMKTWWPCELADAE